MPSDRADDSPGASPGRVHPRAALGRILAPCVLTIAIAVVTAGCSHDTSITPPTSSGNDVAARADSAQRALDRLETAVASRQVSGTGLTRAIVTNAEALGVEGLQLDYVDASPGALTAAEQQRYGDSAWVASVRTSFRLAADATTTHMEVAFTFVTRSGAVSIAAVGGHEDRAPLWLAGPVRVGTAARATVIDAGATPPAHYLQLARQAVEDVHRVLPAWRGNLVVEVPRDEAELDTVLAAKQATYANIAAVTTTVDGSLAPDAPIHVFLNPRVFGTLKAQGAQVVLSHETTHVATRAPLAQMPTWLLEGFADYVALAHAGVPVSLAAAQIIQRIRKNGPPAGLPSANDLQPTANGLGATYEEAWLACRYLAATYGESTLVRFYRAVDAGNKVGDAFRKVVGVTQAQFVSGWRKSLRQLAG